MRPLLPLAMTLTLCAACDSGGAAEPAAPASTTAKAEAAATQDAPAAAEAEAAPKAPVDTGSFKFTVTGESLSGEWSGSKAKVYDMAGFVHIGLYTKKLEMMIDFNTTGTERPKVGKYPLVASNLKGWTFTLEEGRADDDPRRAKAGELEITAVEGPRFEGRFSLDAAHDRAGDGKVKIEGEFVAFDPPKKK